MKKTALFLAISALGSAPAFAQFTNGGFETGDTTGWSATSSVQRSAVDNTGLTPTYITTRYGTNPAPQHSAIIDTTYVDPNVGAAIGSLVQSGNYAYRVEDTTSGGYASVISQSVKNYSDPDIFFAWKAVLLGAHDATSAATMKITLTDDTLGTVLLSREYNAASGGGGVVAVRQNHPRLFAADGRRQSERCALRRCEHHAEHRDGDGDVWRSGGHRRHDRDSGCFDLPLFAFVLLQRLWL